MFRRWVCFANVLSVRRSEPDERRLRSTCVRLSWAKLTLSQLSWLCDVFHFVFQWEATAKKGGRFYPHLEAWHGLAFCAVLRCALRIFGFFDLCLVRFEAQSVRVIRDPNWDDSGWKGVTALIGSLYIGRSFFKETACRPAVAKKGWKLQITGSHRKSTRIPSGKKTSGFVRSWE